MTNSRASSTYFTYEHDASGTSHTYCRTQTRLVGVFLNLIVPLSHYLFSGSNLSPSCWPLVRICSFYSLVISFSMFEPGDEKKQIKESDRQYPTTISTPPVTHQHQHRYHQHHLHHNQHQHQQHHTNTHTTTTTTNSNYNRTCNSSFTFSSNFNINFNLNNTMRNKTIKLDNASVGRAHPK